MMKSVTLLSTLAATAEVESLQIAQAVPEFSSLLSAGSLLIAGIALVAAIVGVYYILTSRPFREALITATALFLPVLVWLKALPNRYSWRDYGEFHHVEETTVVSSGATACLTCGRIQESGMKFHSVRDTVRLGVVIDRERSSGNFECDDCLESDPTDLALGLVDHIETPEIEDEGEYASEEPTEEIEYYIYDPTIEALRHRRGYLEPLARRAQNRNVLTGHFRSNLEPDPFLVGDDRLSILTAQSNYAAFEQALRNRREKSPVSLLSSISTLNAVVVSSMKSYPARTVRSYTALLPLNLDPFNGPILTGGGTDVAQFVPTTVTILYTVPEGATVKQVDTVPIRIAEMLEAYDVDVSPADVRETPDYHHMLQHAQETESEPESDPHHPTYYEDEDGEHKRIVGNGISFTKCDANEEEETERVYYQSRTKIEAESRTESKADHSGDDR